MLADRIILACTVILTVLYMYATTLIPVLAIGDPLGPKAFPWLLGIAMLLACGFLAWEIWRPRRKNDQAAAAEPQLEAAGPQLEAAGPQLAAAEPQFDGKVIPVLLVIVLWTGCYYLAFEQLGYVLATLIYLVPMMAWFNRGKWVANFASAALFVGLTYYMFVELEVRLPQGVLPF
jgi:putative tricarboxylic transport membrane protein